MPSHLFWLLVWWAVWFFIMLCWYEAKKKAPLDLKVAFFMFLLSGLTPIIALLLVIKKLISRDK